MIREMVKILFVLLFASCKTITQVDKLLRKGFPIGYLVPFAAVTSLCIVSCASYQMMEIQAAVIY